MRQRAFSLYELLAVLAIITLLMGMILVIPKESDAAKVENAARELQAVMIQARALAMRTGEPHAVVFHIENAGDGHVLKNFPHPERDNPNAATGGHWYAIVGPDKSGNTNNASYLPMFDRDFGDTNKAKKFRCLDDFIYAMEVAQVGERRYLPRGVRFLALSDLDHGHHKLAGRPVIGPTYPRPWYGWYDDGAGRLHAWGGYDPDVDVAIDTANGGRGWPVTGLCYQGADGPIPYERTLDARVDPAQIYGRIGAFDQPRYPGESGATAPLSTASAGRPRPLVNAYWADAMIAFAPDGHAFWVDGYARRKVLDRGGYGGKFLDYRGAFELGFAPEVGGFHITLARDPDVLDEIYPVDDPVTGQPAWHRFADAEDAFESIAPFARVFVAGDTGEVLVKPPSHPDCRISPDDLGSKDPYPAR